MTNINKNVIINLCNDEDQDSNVEVIKDISNWQWLTFLMNESSEVKVETAQEAVDIFEKQFIERFGSEEDEIFLKLKACCQEFVNAVQLELDARGGLDHCSMQLLTWSVEYDTNIACVICTM